MFAANEFREVERESEGVEEGESLVARNFRLAGSLRLVNDTLQEFDAVFQRAEERTLLLLHHLHHQFLLSSNLGEGIPHLVHKRRHKFVDERFLLTEERVAVAHGTAQDATNHIARLGVRWQLTVSNGKRDGTQVVHHHTHGNVRLLILTIPASRHVAQHLNERLEHVSVIVGSLTLQRAHQTFKAHARVNHLGRQSFKRTICLAVVLHEHEIPNLNHLRVVFVHQLTTGHLCLLLFRTRIHMNLRAGATRSCVTHLPEVVMPAAIDDVVFRQELFPNASRLIITGKPLLGAALEDSGIEVLRVNLQHIHNVLPSPRNRLLLEVVTKRPVAQHLKHRVVIGVVSHLLQVIMLAAHTQTLLRVRLPPALRCSITQDNVLKLIHACIRKHQRRVVLHDHGSRWHNQVLLAFKELFERLTYLFCCHNFIYNFSIYNLQFIYLSLTSSS